MDEDGSRLAHARRVFATTREMRRDMGSICSELYLSLGRWTKATRSSRFRLSLKAARDDAVESFDAPFEIGHYSLVWLTAGTREVPGNLVMLRGVHFDRSDKGHVQARLRAGGHQVADTEWGIRLELLDADNQTLQSVVTVLTTTKEHECQPLGISSIIHPLAEKNISLSLGEWGDVSEATRFRISLWLDKE